MTNEYALVGASVGDTKKYHVILDDYSDTIQNEDTVETGITGLPLIHRSTLHGLWVGTFRIHASEPTGYGAASDLEALYRSQTTIYWQSPQASTPIGVKWIGAWEPRYITPPLSELVIPFVFREATPS